MKKVAILISVFLERMDEFRTQIDNFFEDDVDYDVFIFTYKRFAKYVDWFPNVKKYGFVEDNPEAMKKEKEIQKMKEPSNIFQYFNLKICFKMIEDYMEETNTKYDYIYRIRTRSKTSPFVKTDLTKPFWVPNNLDDDTIYSKSDQFYVGTYNSMKKISCMCDLIFSDYYGIQKNQEYWPLNFNTIMKSDMDSVRFDMLVYPNIISQKALDDFSDSGPHQKDPTINKETLKNEIIQKIDELNKYVPKNGDKFVTAPSGMKKRNFRAEKTFAYYVSSVCNLVVKELPNIRKGG